jgi:hypothetical protein
VTAVAEVEERRQGKDRRRHPMSAGPWYKHVDVRVSLLLLAVWISVALLIAIGAGVLKDVRLNHHIEDRQLNQRDRACLIITDLRIADPKGLCSPETLAREDRG